MLQRIYNWSKWLVNCVVRLTFRVSTLIYFGFSTTKVVKYEYVKHWQNYIDVNGVSILEQGHVEQPTFGVYSCSCSQNVMMCTVSMQSAMVSSWTCGSGTVFVKHTASIQIRFSQKHLLLHKFLNFWNVLSCIHLLLDFVKQQSNKGNTNNAGNVGIM
jgi:hypothetical protein